MPNAVIANTSSISDCNLNIEPAEKAPTKRLPLLRVPKSTRKKKLVQDSEREILQAAVLGLVRTGERLGVDSYDILGNGYEQKVSTKAGTSTARNTGPKTLARWRQVNWVISRGDNFEDGFVFHSHYFLAPCHLEGWFRTLEAGFAEADGFRDKILRLCGDALTEEEVSRLTRIHYNGMLLNNPNIPWTYVVDHGIRLEGDVKAHLLELATKYPAPSAVPQTRIAA